MRRHLSAGPEGHQPQRVPLEFDFVVAQRPEYVPGSGPPLGPITIMPPRDIDGSIVSEIELYKELRYVVRYEKHPHLRVAVRPQNILKWVSARALEDWESDEYERKQREREELELPLIEAKEERRRKRLEKIQKPSRGLQPKEVKSRKRKRTPVPEKPVKTKTPATSNSKRRPRRRGPGHRNEQEEQEEEDIVFTSPKMSQHSQQQPSLSSPGLANRAILDSESEDEDSVTQDMAIDLQLKGQTRRSSRSNLQSSPSTSQTPDRLSPNLSNPNQRRRSHNIPSSFLSDKSAVAATTSSREARQTYEEIERKAQNKAPTITDKYSHTRKQSQFLPKKPSKLQHSTAASSSRPSNVESEEEEIDQPEEESEEEAAAGEEVYELKTILQDEIRVEKNGTQARWFLIDWVGDWNNTWEPEENIDPAAVLAYKKRGKQKSRFGAGGSQAAFESDSDSLFIHKRKGKGKMAQRGQVVDDVNDGDDDSDGLF